MTQTELQAELQEVVRGQAGAASSSANTATPLSNSGPALLLRYGRIFLFSYSAFSLPLTAPAASWNTTLLPETLPRIFGPLRGLVNGLLLALAGDLDIYLVIAALNILLLALLFAVYFR